MSVRLTASTVALGALVFVVASGYAGSSAAETFTYNPAGTLKSGSGTGHQTTKNWAPGIRFPIKDAPAYLNSQVYGNGGLYGPGGGQCDKANFSYPWWDNYCEKRSWTMPLCPSGKGHQGQDMRATTCEKNKWWAVATIGGTITSIGTYTVYLKGDDGRTHRYGHLQKASLQVKVGSKVSKGQLIGKVSNEFGGTPTSVHLHFDLIAYVSGIGTTYVSPYNALVESYKALIGQTTPTCDAAACAAKSGCGSWSACGGFSDVCDETGTRSRTCTTYACSGGSCKGSSKTETGTCSVDTDGKEVAAWSAWSTCGEFTDACDESGSQSRSRKVCKAGKAIDEQQQQSCSVDTDGKEVAAWSAWSACAGFDHACDSSGAQSRSRTVCESGQAVSQSEQQGCTLATDGKALGDWGPWSVCAGFAEVCAEQGVQSRSRPVCQGDAETLQSETQACSVDKSGAEVEPWGPWSVCLTGADPCVGVRTRKRKVCGEGAVTVQSQSEPCQGGDCGDVAGDVAGAPSGGADADAADAAGELTADGVDGAVGTGDGVSAVGDGLGTEDPGVVLPQTTPSGCSARAGSRPSTPGAWWLLALPLALVLRRRRSSYSVS